MIHEQENHERQSPKIFVSHRGGDVLIEFFTGKVVQQGNYNVSRFLQLEFKSDETSSSLQELPLYVRAGSIVPMGNVQEWYNQDDSPLTVRIYPGCDGSFKLYDDDGICNTFQPSVRHASKSFCV